MGLKPAPEFEAWLKGSGIFAAGDEMKLAAQMPRPSSGRSRICIEV